MEKKKWNLWMEGYDFVGILASGRNEARFYGTVEAETFVKACDEFFKNENSYRSDSVRPSVWGCRLFDNETDARKSYG